MGQLAGKSSASTTSHHADDDKKKGRHTSGKDALAHFHFLDQAESLRKEQKYDEALEQFDLAVESQPSYYFSYVRRAHLLAELGRFSEAQIDLDDALKLRPTDPDVIVARIQLLEMQDEYELAAMEKARIPSQALKTQVEARLKQLAQPAGSDPDSVVVGTASHSHEPHDGSYTAPDGDRHGDDGDDKYAEHERRFRKALQHDEQRRRMVHGQRGHYIQSDGDRRVAKRRLEFQKAVADLRAHEK